MKRYEVRYLPEAERRLAAIEDYIAEHSSPAIAKRFIEGLTRRVARLDRFPLRGSPRDDLLPGLRTIVHRRAVTIAYVVHASQVDIIDFSYRGEDLISRFERE